MEGREDYLLDKKQVIAFDRPVYVMATGKRKEADGKVFTIKLIGIDVLHLNFVWHVTDMEEFSSEEECRLIMESRFTPVVFDAGDDPLNTRNENIMSVIRDANPGIEDVLKGYGLS